MTRRPSFLPMHTPKTEYFTDLLRVTGGETERRTRPYGDPRISHLHALDAQPRRAFPAVAQRNAAPGPHQPLLSGRREGAPEQLLRRSPSDCGIRVIYGAEVIGLKISGGTFESATVLLRRRAG